MLAKEARLASVSSSSSRSRCECALEVVGDVVEQQDEAGESRPSEAAGRTDARFTRAGARRACSVTKRADAFATSPPRAMRRLDGLERMRDQHSVDDAIDRTPEPDQFRAPGALRRA